MIDTTKLPVLSVGYLVNFPVQETHRFQVHSCFEHALNLTAEDGSLLTLLSHHYQNLPAAIRVNAPDGWNWGQVSCRDKTVVAHNNGLFGDGWSVDLNHAVYWRPEPLRANANHQALLQAQRHYPALVNQLVAYCLNSQITSSLQLLPEWPTTGRLPILALKDDGQALEYQVSQLIGFGHGLTPDGDDYLVGYFAALWSWQHLADVAGHLALLSQIIHGQLGKTTDISQHYLTQALQGHFSEPVSRLLAAVFKRASADEVSSSAYQVMQFGASSGVDCLAGLLHGLRSLKSIS